MVASLGAWGGYFILGFDHSVEDDGKGEADFDIVGNPLGKYWCECGVVMGEARMKTGKRMLLMILGMNLKVVKQESPESLNVML